MLIQLCLMKLIYMSESWKLLGMLRQGIFNLNWMLNERKPINQVLNYE